MAGIQNQKKVRLIGLLSVTCFLASCIPMFLGPLGVDNATERFILGHLGAMTKVRIKTISFSASENANEDSPVKIHLVMIYDPHLIAEFLKLPASKYFKLHHQIERDHKATLFKLEWNIPPGGKIDEQKVDYPGTPVAAFLYAQYSTPGDHRLRVGPHRDVLVLLEEKDWQLVKAPPLE